MKVLIKQVPVIVLFLIIASSVSCFDVGIRQGKYRLVSGKYCSDFMVIEKLNGSEYLIKTYMTKTPEVMNEFTGTLSDSRLTGRRGQYDFIVSFSSHDEAVIFAKSDKYEINGTYKRIE